MTTGRGSNPKAADTRRDFGMRSSVAAYRVARIRRLENGSTTVRPRCVTPRIVASTSWIATSVSVVGVEPCWLLRLPTAETHIPVFGSDPGPVDGWPCVPKGDLTRVQVESYSII